MKSLFYFGLTVLMLGTSVLHGAASIDETMKRAVADYDQRLIRANDELIQARERIAKEKMPLLKAVRAAEDRIIVAETEITRFETAQEQSVENHRKLGKEADALRKNENYLNTLTHDSLSAYDDGLLPGERQFLPSNVEALRDAFNDPAKLADGQKAVEVPALLLAQVRQSLGGYRANGTLLIDGDNKVVTGTFAFVGPEVFFRTEQGAIAGTVRVREGTGGAVMYPLSEWKPATAEAFFQGGHGMIPADASAGKALRLKETKGTIWQHISKGGVVSYGIIGVGLLALGLIGQKIYDLSRMGMDDSRTVQRCLDAVAAGHEQDAGQLVRLLKTTTRDLFAAGLRYRGESKELLEERLTAVLLRQRLHFERWLPLLAVIATAAPLMGLLGTVTGMVRTFTLITVFGTGNAGKLASGISEVLVATELGLLVAIPTLVAHGFLSQRIQKNLSLLERYALEFVTAIRADKSKQPNKESISA